MQGYSLVLNIISGCWLVFVAIWVLAAVSTKRTVYRETRAQRLRYWVLLVIAYLLLLYGQRLPYPLNLGIIPHVAPTAWAAAVLCVIGLAFAVWARVILGRNWSGVVTLKEGHELIERGPYRVARHPIYTGILAMFAGTALAMGYFGGFLGLFLVFVSFWVKLKREEDLMLKHFPAKYAAYQRRVKRIIPFLI